MVNIAVNRVSHSCLLTELGPICNFMVASTCLKSFEAHILLKTLMEVYGKPFTGLGPANSLEVLMENAIE